MPLELPVYMDNQSTTRTDPRVVDAMLPYLSEIYGNAGSSSHAFGWDAKQAVDLSRSTLADVIGAKPNEIVFTSGATESNNLALRGVTEHPRRQGNHLVSVVTEHKAILDPLARLQRRGMEVTLLPVKTQGEPAVGLITAEQVEQAIRPDTILVSVMLANNEIGVLQPLQEIAEVCRKHAVLLHTDAAQAVGRVPVDVASLGVDLMSFTAHKIYGPKGIGALYVGRASRRMRLEPLLTGGGQEMGLRSGTLNVAGCVGFARAIELCQAGLSQETGHLQDLRNRLYEGLTSSVQNISLNGPLLDDDAGRLPGNLNMCFSGVDGESLMMSMGNLAVSSGSACTSSDPEPSHVLRALGLDDDATRSSLRFSLGRFNTVEEVEFAVGAVSDAVHRLRALSG